MKKVFIFDFDGTIVDSMNQFADIASKVLNKYFGTPVEEARHQYFQTSGLPFFEQVALLHPGDAKNGAAAAEYESTKEKEYLFHKKFDDVTPMLAYFKANGIKAVVSSNNFQGLVDSLVDKLQLKFDLVLGWQENFAKGRDHFEHVKKTLKCSIDEMVFVGDSLKDYDRAREYSIDFIGKTGTFSREDFKKHFADIVTIDSLNDLKGIK